MAVIVDDEQTKLTPVGSLSEMRATPRPLERFIMPFQLGDMIAQKYEIMRLIGTGGVGFVVAARHIGFDEVVALKFLRPEIVTHVEAVSRFTIEARASFKIRSEHVARVLDVDTLEDGTPFIAMELLEGTDLRGLLGRWRVLATERAVDYALQTCEALAAAHARRIIHRDIKPENLFLIGDGEETERIKVLDFGISKVALVGKRGELDQALTRVAVGTPPYMSPEQVRASSDLDERSDIWSLGCVLYELLSGTAPFDRPSLMQSCAAVLEEDPVPLRDLRPISQGLADVVMRCLEKAPSARYQDVAELAEGLARFGSGQLASYPERCRALLAGEILGRRSTPSVLPPARRHHSLPPVVAASRRSSQLDLEPGHSQRESVRPREQHTTDNTRMTDVEALMQLRPRHSPWLIAAIAAIAFVGIYLLTYNKPTTPAHVATGAPLLSPTMTPDVSGALQPDDVGNTMALQPPAAKIYSGEPATRAAAPALASDLPTGASSPSEGPPRARAKSATRSRKYSVGDEIDVGF